MAKTSIYWQTKTTPPELRGMLTELGKTYPIAKGAGRGLEVRPFRPGAGGRPFLRLTSATQLSGT